MRTFKQHLDQYNRLRRFVRETREQEADGLNFKRGNLVMHRSSRGKAEFYNRWFLILGTVVNVDWGGRDVLQYLVKTSNTTRPTLNSKGHYMMTVDVKDVEQEYIVSLREAFKDL